MTTVDPGLMDDLGVEVVLINSLDISIGVYGADKAIPNRSFGWHRTRQVAT
jgi:hypothetical protein